MKRDQLFTAGYVILPEHRLVIDARFGSVSSDILKDYMKCIFMDKQYDPTYDFLVDTREMNFNIIVSDMQPYVLDLNKMEGAFCSKKKIAGIYSSIHQLAYTQFIQKEFSKLNQPLEFFSDIPSALSWLSSSISVDEVEGIIESIKTKPQFIWKTERL